MKAKPFYVRGPIRGWPFWSIKQGERWRFAEDIVIQVQTETTYQDGEYLLHGVGVVHGLGRRRLLVTA